MSLFSKTTVLYGAKGVPRVSSGQRENVAPFAPILTAVDPVSVKISRYSKVLTDFNLAADLFVAGLNCPVEISYGDKIWLEVFYDKNLVPVFGLINSGAKWTATSITGGAAAELYPSQIELFRSSEISNKTTVLNNAIASLNAFKISAAAELLKERQVLAFTEEEYDAILTKSDEDYATGLAAANTLLASLGAFFSSAPTSSFQKLFRTYTLLAYTTKDFNGYLDGKTIETVPALPTSNISTPQRAETEQYNLIPCVSSDLAIVDICYQNRYAAKIPIPYGITPRYFPLANASEEETNTA